MTSDDIAQFNQIWAASWGFYGKEATTMIQAMAFQALKKYSLNEIKQALSNHLSDPEHGKWAPKPADVVRYIDGGPDARAAKALTIAYETAQRCGGYESVCFDDPVIHQVIRDMGGWIVWCEIEEKERPFKHNEFQKRYVGIASGQPGEYVTHLPGRNELHNSRNGFDGYVKQPLLIGNEEKAKKVYLTGSSSSKVIKRLESDFKPMKMIE